jgi:hypothetical protein
MADRRDADDVGQRVVGPQQQRTLVVAGEQRGVLVNPAMDADFVAGVADAARLVRIDQRGNGWHEECCGYAVPLQDVENAGDANAPAELAPGEPAHGTAAHAEFGGFVIAIERQCHGASCAVLPRRRPQRRAGAHAPQQALPMLLRPFEWRNISAARWRDHDETLHMIV